MDNSLHPLLPVFERARAAGTPLVLATVTATRGSTYRKAGAQLLIGPGGKVEGLLSGGCLEGDLAEHAAPVLATGAPKLVRYETPGEDDLVWGLGSGCEGGMDIWLTRLDAETGWEPFATIADRLEQYEAVAYGLVLDSAIPSLPAGAVAWPPGVRPQPSGLPEPVSRWIAAQLVGGDRQPDACVVELDEPRLRMFVATVVPARQFLVIGAGPDALPVVHFAAILGWHVTLADHRPAYADSARFPGARRVLQGRPGELAGHVQLSQFDAALIMTHHLATDLAALATLASTRIPYVGLLGPPARRKRLLADLDPAAAAMLDGRLRAPVGLDLGGRGPASIALGVVAELQAFFHGREHGGAARVPRAAHDRADTLHVVLLGAGSSSRFGQPKQLAEIDGRPMLARALDTALAFANGRGEVVTVVLGAHAGRLAPLVGATTASMVVNPGFEEGIASSIRTGIACAPPSARGAMILLADQATVTADDLRRLVARWEEDPALIVAADYGSSYGAPAIFPRDLFPELATLHGDRGARALMLRHPDRVATVAMPSAAVDVDTPADLGTLLSHTTAE